MNETILKLKSAITSIEKKNGPLVICALFLREEPLEKWDILISAPWLNPTEMVSYQAISDSLKEFLNDSEFIDISRIVILSQDDPVVSYLLNLDTISNGGFKELHTDVLSERFKFIIKRAYLLRSQKL